MQQVFEYKIDEWLAPRVLRSDFGYISRPNTILSISVNENNHESLVILSFDHLNKIIRAKLFFLEKVERFDAWIEQVSKIKSR